MSTLQKNVFLVFILFVSLFFSTCDNSMSTDVKPDWLVFTNDDMNTGYANIWNIDNDSHVATGSISDHDDWIYALMSQRFSNFDLKFDFNKTEGLTSDVVTVYVHVKDKYYTGASENEYMINFGVGSGSYYIGYVDENHTWHSVTSGWISTSDINTGLNSWNSVRIVRFENDFYLYINGNKQGQYTDASRTDGYLGLGGGHWDNSSGTTTIRFEDWSCKEITELPSDL